MSTTTMHFGPEWMRTKHQAPSRPHQPPSPPLSNPPPSSASTYSALVSPAPPVQPEKRDEVHPFRYSKEELLRIYKDGGGKGGLGLEVERWEGVVREVGSEPVGLREMNDSEKKLFAGPLNSDLRRRQSTDYLSPLSTQGLGAERSRISLNSPASGTGSPLRERFGVLRRRDSTDQPPLPIPRKQSLSNLQPPSMSPREVGLPSPRTRGGYTPGFDGVLNNGDSWVARRRASEASLKSGPAREGEQDGKALDIREEEEDSGILSQPKPEDDAHLLSSSRMPSQPNTNGSMLRASPDISGDMAHISINTPVVDIPSNQTSSMPSGIADLASVEWSYKDPSGQVQGPFRADLMQKWFDDGYFTPDLPMKRTHLDSQWISVEDLAQRSGGGKIFLTLPAPALPPGLSHRTDSPLPNFPISSDQHIYNGPYQPAPLRSLRSSTLDSFGSNPSDSPSSSFGGGRFGNGSPDPSAFGGRAGYFVNNEAPVGGRVASFNSMPDPAGAFTGRRNTYNDTSLDPSLNMRSSFGGVVPGRGLADGYGYNRAYSPGQGPWNSASNQPNSSFEQSNMGRNSTDPIPYTSNFASGPANSFGNLRGSQDNVFGEGFSYQQPIDYNTYNGLGSSSPALNQQYTHSPATQFATPQQLQQPSPSAVYNQHGGAPQPHPINPQSIGQMPALGSMSSQSPWANEVSPLRRPGPFEAGHPTSANTTTIQPVPTPEVSPWTRTSQPSRPESQVNEGSPWPASGQQGGVVEAEREGEPGPSSLTFSNVGQHNQQQQQLAAPTVTAPITAIIPESADPPHPHPDPVEPNIPSLDIAPKAVVTKTKAKVSNQVTQPPAAKSAPLTPQVTADPPPQLSAPKPAWAKEDEVTKPKPSGVSMSLRDIQEAEAKKVEARKVAEREKERAARASASVVETKEETQPFTASWGLPTSQAGARSTPVKETTTSPNSTTPPVWTTAAKPQATKKTMKEIQEEEEKRKRTAAKETTAAVAARRAYAESTTKAAPPVQGSAWTTVGPSGKASAVVTPPARPTIATSTSTLSMPGSSSRVNGTVVPRAVPVSPTLKATPPAARIEDVSPSHEFLKWLSDSLKGLNNSVNVEEIMSMLLSFPMDPDPSTVELISELIYANSTTLDGRRFASEFITKRKADASSRPKGIGSSKSTGKISIADVVKATPKPTQPEWGFKVVNKKKKGGRA